LRAVILLATRLNDILLQQLTIMF